MQTTGNKKIISLLLAVLLCVSAMALTLDGATLTAYGNSGSLGDSGLGSSGGEDKDPDDGDEDKDPDYIPVTGISLNLTYVELEIGESEQLIATVEPDNATYPEFDWRVNITGSPLDFGDCFEVQSDNSMLITALKEGTATVQVSTRFKEENGAITNHASADCVVVIRETPAVSGPFGNLEWSFNGRDTLHISGTGAMPNIVRSSAWDAAMMAARDAGIAGTSGELSIVPWISYVQDITTVIIDSGVTTVGSNVFANMPNLSDVTIPHTVTSIGSGAFAGCSSLERVSIPDSVAAIADSAFNGCSDDFTLVGSADNAYLLEYAKENGIRVVDEEDAVLYDPQSDEEDSNGNNTGNLVVTGSGSGSGGYGTGGGSRKTGGGSGGGGSGGGRSASSADQFSSTLAVTNGSSNNVNADGTVNATILRTELEEAIRTASSNTVYVRTRNARLIEAATLRMLSNTASGAGKTVILYADTLNAAGSAVQGRLYVEPSGLSAAIQPGVYVDDSHTAAVRNKFAQASGNTVAVVTLDHKAAFGSRLQVAAKVSLAGLDTGSLRFYSYNRSTNEYTAITSPEYSIDVSGYLHFHTETGGDIIITDAPLQI